MAYYNMYSTACMYSLTLLVLLANVLALQSVIEQQRQLDFQMRRLDEEHRRCVVISGDMNQINPT